MTGKIIKFSLQSLFLTAFLIPINFYIIEELVSAEFAIAHYLTYGYFFALSVAIFAFLLKGLEERPQQFVTKFMAAMAGKLFLSMILLISHIYFNKSGAKIYAVNFLILYLVYSFYVSYIILRLNRKQKA